MTLTMLYLQFSSTRQAMMWLKLQKQTMTPASQVAQFSLTMMEPQPSLSHHRGKDTSSVGQWDIAAKE